MSNAPPGTEWQFELLGGRLDIDTSPGQGARVAVSVPLLAEGSHV